eukprot:s2628_g3.t1
MDAESRLDAGSPDRAWQLGIAAHQELSPAEVCKAGIAAPSVFVNGRLWFPEFPRHVASRILEMPQWNMAPKWDIRISICGPIAPESGRASACEHLLEAKEAEIVRLRSELESWLAQAQHGVVVEAAPSSRRSRLGLSAKQRQQQDTAKATPCEHSNTRMVCFHLLNSGMDHERGIERRRLICRAGGASPCHVCWSGKLREVSQQRCRIWWVQWRGCESSGLRFSAREEAAVRCLAVSTAANASSTMSIWQRSDGAAFGPRLC